MTVQARPDVNDVLNRLLRLLARSLPMYLEQGRWRGSADDQQHWLKPTLGRLLTDQRLFAGPRWCRPSAIAMAGRTPGPFPAGYAAVNDGGIGVPPSSPSIQAGARRCCRPSRNVPAIWPMRWPPAHWPKKSSATPAGISTALKA